MKYKFNSARQVIALGLCVFTLCFFIACETDFELPEANSIEDTILPTADFSYIPDGDNFETIIFTDLSFESTRFSWDFGGGATSTEQDPTHTFDGEGTYPVTLTASDENGESNSKTIDVVVVDVFVAITPTVENGDFEGGRDNWEFENFTGGTTTSFNTSGDGSPLNYDGSESGSTKTAGAKYTMGTAAEELLSGDSRFAYQPLVVSPNTEYILEFEYAIKNEVDGNPAPGIGDRLVGGILDGHFSDGADALSSFDAAPLLKHSGQEVLGKGNFTTVKESFTSNESGNIALFFYGVTNEDSYLDNVKVYPAD